MKKKQNPVFWGIMAFFIALILFIVLYFNDVVDLTGTIITPIITGTVIAIIGLVPAIKEQEEKEEQKKTFSKFLKSNSIADRTNSNPFDYRNPYIGLYGREKECARIRNFLDTGEQQKVWAVTGHGGMGKSKLAFHIAKEYKQEDWHVFWLTETTIEELLKCEIDTKGRHLFICDYAGRYTDSIAKLLKKLHEKNVHFRMLLLERASYGDSSTDTESWFAKLRRCETAEELFSSYDLEYCEDPLSPAPLNLTQHLLDENAYGKILDDFAKAKGRTFTTDQKKEIIAFVRNGMKHGTNERSGEDNRCLFLLFTADAVLNGGRLKMLDKAGVFQSYIRKKMEDHFPPELKDHEKTALLLLALATAGGAFDLCDTQTGKCEEWCAELRGILPEERSAIAGVLSVLCERSDADTTAVTPLLPDLLGEFLVMYVYKEYKPKELFPLLFADNCRDHFEDFLTRLLSDWGEDARAKTFVDSAEQWAKDNGKSADRILLAHVYHNVGSLCYDRAEYGRAREYYKKAIVIKEAECGENTIDTAATYNNLGIVYDSMGKYPEAVEWHEKALKIYEAVYGENHPSTADTYNNLGPVYDSMGKYPEALNLYEKALKIKEAVYGENHPSTADTYNNLGIVCRKQGKYPEAVEWYEKALKIKEAVYGENHPSTADTYNNLGLIYDSLSKYSEAVEWYEKALKIYEAVYGKKHPSTADTYNNLGNVYDSMGKYPEAVEWYEKALKINEAVYGENHPSTAVTYNNLGVVYQEQGRYPEAVKWYEKALKIYEAVYGENHPSTAETYNNLGVVCRKQGKYPEAVEWYEKALKIKEAVYGENHPSTAETYNNLGVVCKNQDKYPQALEYYAKAHTIFQNTYGDDHPHTQLALRGIHDVETLLNHPK